ncbi:TVP38/TMEM64 family protein [Paenibacillus turpanensis]|uniref:TVP38/TMEM64 family protein n=1 Tax=Paenibacillus turpanensis TaxID=2689078 RepID=UPI0014082F2F|nr:TVP38/TMEM64 family protein [Paenibacillus turpanensis]
MKKKLGLAIFYLAIGCLLYLYGEAILGWFRDADNVILVIVMATVMALFPVIPYPIVGGVIGAAYGPALGGIMTWTGSTIASILMFLFVRYGYQDWGKKVLHKYKNIERTTVLFEKNAFLFILFARMIPFIPSIIVNVYAALSRVSFGMYAIPSSLGKIPAMLLFALVGDSLLTEPRNVVITIAVYGFFLALTLYIYQQWRKKHEQG